MASNAPNTTVACPQCRQPVAVHLEQLVDAGADPGAKQRLLKGQLNLLSCPLCGQTSMLGTPLVYHDPAKELLLTFVPMELNMRLQDKENLLGSLTRQVVSRTPADQRKGYLLRPQEMLSLQNLINRILEADGITPEMLDSQRAKLQLLQDLLKTDASALPALIQQRDAEIDVPFVQILGALLQRATGNGAAEQDTAVRLAALSEQVALHSTIGRSSSRQTQVLEEVAEELQALGTNLTRDTLLQLVCSNPDELRTRAVVTLVRQLVDYEFFVGLTKQIDKAAGEQRKKLEAARQVLLDTVARSDAAAKAQGTAAAQLLQALLQAPDETVAVREALPEISDLTLAILNQNIEAAQKAGQQDAIARLTQLRATIMAELDASTPPALRFINDLMQSDTPEAAAEMLRNRSAELTEELLQSMVELAQDLEARGHADMSAKLKEYHGLAQRELSLAKWR